MSEIAANARVSFVVADFAGADVAGKVNIIGGGVAVLGFTPEAGVTSRFTVWADIWVPTALCPAEFAVEIALVDAGENLVSIPGPAGPQALRVAQVVQIEKPTAQIPAVQREHIGSRAQIVFDFGNGLPLPPGGMYKWRMQIDGDVDREWTYPWAVAGPPAPPVIG